MPSGSALIAQATVIVSGLLHALANGDYDSVESKAIDATRALEEVLSGSGREDEELALILAQATAVVLSERYHNDRDY